jgi:hypothetical protein
MGTEMRGLGEAGSSFSTYQLCGGFSITFCDMDISYRFFYRIKQEPLLFGRLSADPSLIGTVRGVDYARYGAFDSLR